MAIHASWISLYLNSIKIALTQLLRIIFSLFPPRFSQILDSKTVKHLCTTLLSNKPPGNCLVYTICKFQAKAKQWTCIIKTLEVGYEYCLFCTLISAHCLLCISLLEPVLRVNSDFSNLLRCSQFFWSTWNKEKSFFCCSQETQPNRPEHFQMCVLIVMRRFRWRKKTFNDIWMEKGAMMVRKNCNKWTRKTLCFEEVQRKLKWKVKTAKPCTRLPSKH